MEISHAHWAHREENYAGIVVSHECYCSNCEYIAMRYSHMIRDFRSGMPFAMPDYKYCPNCGKRMENEYAD